jgi:Glycoside hydrolase family 44
MTVNNDVNWGGAVNPVRTNNAQYGSEQNWNAPLPQRMPPSEKSKRKGHRRLFVLLSVLLLVMLILATVRVMSVAGGNNDQLVLSVGNQEQSLIDLRQPSIPISPYLYGVNVFPKVGTSSVDTVKGKLTGFMSYNSSIINSMQNAGIKLLRFPGGNWGEDQPRQNHILSYEQLYDFSTLLYQVGADGMIQARLSNPINASGTQSSLPDRANLAGNWVDFMSNPQSNFRIKNHYENKPIHPIKFWSVGNEPDKLTDPDQPGKPLTVAAYVNDFIQYSIAMHNNNPTIKVFGPEISQFYGLGAGPKDSNSTLWMEGFLDGVAKYEKVHPELKFHLLDGVSFHRYQFTDASTAPNLLMSSADEWNYLLPSLRQHIRQTMGRDLPVAITEINSNPNTQVPTSGQAALWWADTLGTLMNQQAEFVAFFSAEGVNKPYPLFNDNGSYSQTAMYRVMELFSHLQHNLIPLQMQHDPVSVYATQDDTHQTVSLLFINKSGTNQFAEVSSQNQLFGFSPWHAQDISIGANSIVLITLHRNGGAEALSFLVPSANEASINALKQYVCGKKTDPLGYTIPC